MNVSSQGPRPPSANGRRACILRQTTHYEPPIRREAEALVGAGFDVDVILMRGTGTTERATVNGVDITYLPTSLRKTSKLRYLVDYARFFARATGTIMGRHLGRRYSVIQVNTMPDFLVFAALPAKLFGAKVVAYMHEPSPELAETIFGRGLVTRILAVVEQAVLRFADHSIAVTDQLKQRYVERGARPEGISVVLNGADPETLLGDEGPPPARRDDGKFRLISHGSVEERYGQDTIVEAARILREELPELEVVLTGRGKWDRQIRELIEAAQLQDVVRFEGWVSTERLDELLRSADVGIVAQKGSPYSHLVHTNKMVDFWIYGLPVIASRLDAVAATYGDTAIEYYEPGNAAALAVAIRRLHADPERREALILGGTAANERYGWKVQRETYLGVIDALLDGRG